MTFVVFADSELAVRFDQIASVRALSEEDIDTRTGNLRSGIPADSVTEVVTARGTYYTSVPFADVLNILVQLGKPTHEVGSDA